MTTTRNPIPGPHIPAGVETYLRVVAEIGQDRSAILGLELRDEDDDVQLENEARFMMEMVAMLHPTGQARGLAEVIAQKVVGRFPDRAWFLEVERHEGAWVQVYYPWAFAHRDEERGPVCEGLG